MEAGRHRLLVRAQQGRGRFDFSFNICEPIDDEFYAGNRYPGVRYFVRGGEAPAPALRVRSVDEYDGWFMAAHESTIEAIDAVDLSRGAPEKFLIENVERPSQASLMGVLAQSAGLQRTDLDSASYACLSRLPFALGYIGFGREDWWPGYAPDPGRLLGWLGLKYSISSGHKHRESLKEVCGWVSIGRTPVLGYDEEWFLVTGYRQSGEDFQLHMVKHDDEKWESFNDNWWGRFPDSEGRNCPLIVVEKDGKGLDRVALVDSVSALALELALRAATENDPEAWGTRSYPAGLAAWDAWVIDWERLPLTAEWAEGRERTQDDLTDLGQDYLPELAEGRRLAAAYFAAAATAAEGERRTYLGAAARAYGEVVAALEEMSAFLPRRADEEEGLEARGLERIAGARPFLRRARMAERDALGMLAAMLGRQALPSAAEDPLRDRTKGRKLLSWRAGFSNGIYDLTLHNGEELKQERRNGKEAEDVEFKFFDELPQEAGWRVVVEVIKGGGVYQVVQQPAAANGWTSVVRVEDDQWRWDDTETEVVLWAFPKEG